MGEQLLLDLGGTHCRLGLARDAKFDAVTARIFKNAAFGTLTDMVRSYLNELRPGRIDAVCAAVAGPVRGDQAQLTNHSWKVHACDLISATGAVHVHLLNDLQAQAYALDDLAPDDVAPIVPGQADPDGARLVLVLGTGCNIAVAHNVNGRIFVPSAEAGHSTLPDVPQFRALFDTLRRDMPHLPVEAALSGPGLTRLHAHLSGETLSPPDIMAAAPKATLQSFVTLLGHVASSFCISHLATGGLFLAGGTARAIAPHLADNGFRDAFHLRGPYTSILRDIPVSVITDDLAALRGGAQYLAQQL
ncbi:glucokinase [Roseovarius phycicola]|uniref:Glucokinase n=1 Tax=Roseovarius phycicola TaxID=3080976 RepID=A0ABZ2HMD1_9RHOB